MKKRLSGIILATEIAAIVMMHMFKLNHQEKTGKLLRPDATQQANINISHSYSFSNLK